MAMKQITKGYPNWDVPYNENVDEYNKTIGNTNMETKATTITGAIKEIKELAETETSKIQTVVADVNNNKTKIAEHTSLLNDKVNKSDIANDCNTNDATKILGADQGKYLKDYIDKINARTLCILQRENENLGLEQIVSPGWHIIRTNVNAPEADGEFVVEVINPYPSTNTFVIQHIYSLWSSKIYLRFFTSGTGLWGDYKTLL